ncbi:MAG: hypothetical protein WDZ35_13395 [Crocinitomicaceae bacterium]
MSTLTINNHNPFDSFGELIAPFFTKKTQKKRSSLLDTFTKNISKSNIKKLDKCINQLDESIVEMKENHYKYNDKKSLELIEEGKFLLKLLSNLASLVDIVDDKDDITVEMSTKFKIVGDRIESVIALAETYNEVNKLKKEIEEGKTISDIDKAFSI